MTLLARLVETSEHVASMSGRRAKIDALASFLRGVAEAEIEVAVAYLAGETRQSRLGIGYAMLRDAKPDDGATEPFLALLDVDVTLERITSTSGRGSQAERTRLLSDLLRRATPREQDFLARLALGELRQGALEGLMIEAVAQAAALPAAEVRRAAMIAGGVAAIAYPALVRGASGLARFAIALFQPLAPMLAQPADDIADALARVPVAALEWKLDGARVQVHKSGSEVRVYTRTGNDVTAGAPEIVEAVQRVSDDALILDGEAIVLKDDGAPMPFQDTMRRFGRTQDVGNMRKSMPLSVFFFDCLRRDGDDLTGSVTSVRFDALAASLPSPLLMPRLVTSEIDAAQAFYDDALARGHEGVMVKAQDAPYDPGTRSAAWLKVKRAHTLDLVVLAAEWGHGRRQGWLSNLHLGARDAKGGGYVMLGKTFKGMTDAMLEWQTKELLAREVERDAWTVHVRPELVVEITFNDLQASPRYPGGLALRFARVKGYRPDKRADDADTMDTVRAIFAAQSSSSRPQ
jgi:DNA ligase-1